jgi:hypothetical protein
MAGTEMKNVVLIALVVLVIVFVLYQYDSSLCGLLNTYQGFEDVTGDTSAMNEEMQGKKKGVEAGKEGSVKHEGFAAAKAAAEKTAGGDAKMPVETKKGATNSAAKKEEGFANLGSYEGPANFGAAEAPAGCYPRDQITPSELLPKDMNSIWAEQNPMGPGSLKGKNFLSAGALIGVNTVGQSLRNANLQLRSEPPNPQVPVSIFLQSTIAPDISHRPLEIGA